MWRNLKAVIWPYQLNPEEHSAISERIGVLERSIKQDDVSQSILSRIESKSGVLLTHISLMIAVTGVLLTFGEDANWYETLLEIEIAAYLLLALICIRCQFHVDQSFHDSLAPSDKMIHSLLKADACRELFLARLSLESACIGGASFLCTFLR